MSDPYLGEIKIISFNYAPKGWALCNGQLLPINQNMALFSLLGTTYGGDGRVNFALPDLRARAVHMGQGLVEGQMMGEQAHTLIISEMATHNHTVSAASAAPDQGLPTGNEWASLASGYSTANPNTTLAPSAIANSGGSQPHNNMQPYLVLNFVIALQGSLPLPELGASMSNQFVGEIRIFAGNFAPTGWAMCDGQLMPISYNTALFSLLGTYYGGDGKSTFALPNLQGSAPMHQGQGNGLSDRFIGETGGEASVTLLSTEIPVHNHQAMGIGTSNQTAPGPGVVWGSMAGRNPPPLYASGNADVTMGPFATGATGSSFPHNNYQPLLVLNFIIALQGIYPSRGQVKRVFAARISILETPITADLEQFTQRSKIFSAAELGSRRK